MEDNILTEESAPETYMEKTKKSFRPEWILALIAAVLTVVTVALTVFALPYMKENPHEEDPQELL